MRQISVKLVNYRPKVACVGAVIVAAAGAVVDDNMLNTRINHDRQITNGG